MDRCKKTSPSPRGGSKARHEPSGRGSRIPGMPRPFPSPVGLGAQASRKEKPIRTLFVNQLVNVRNWLNPNVLEDDS